MCTTVRWTLHTADEKWNLNGVEKHGVVSSIWGVFFVLPNKWENTQPILEYRSSVVVQLEISTIEELKMKCNSEI